MKSGTCTMAPVLKVAGVVTLPLVSPRVPASTATTYVVQANDTLQGIADRFGVTLAAIVKANKITNPNIIYKGQKLIIPPKVPTP